MKIEGISIQKLPHDGIQIAEKSKFLYIDPFHLKKSYEKANVILITHSHYDHCSIEDIKKLSFDQTIIIATPDCISKLSNLKIKDIKPITPGASMTIDGFMIEAVPAYNIDKEFHPKAQEWVGYIVTVNKKRIYHAGDTDHIPEMKSFKDIDIALLPVSGTYVMTAKEAVLAVSDIKPKIAIPMHYGSIVGNSADAEYFKEHAKVKTIILKEE